MQTIRRPFKEVSVRPILGHKGKDRFDRADEAPRTSSWRCSLTALSHEHNLYFVAFYEEIHIHRPTFPDQTVSGDPILILHLPASAPNLHGYIDPQHPHAVNRILVDYLGAEEVLLAVCDDGDVVGFWLHEIVKYAADFCISPTPQGTSVRTFFHTNTGKSAWGLAVHREARLIAVSSNVQHVTVFALALSKTAKTESPLSSRRTQFVLKLPAVDSNIPAVHFNNTGSDPQGQWLLHSSVDGTVYMWDIHQPSKDPMTLAVGVCATIGSSERKPVRCTCRDRGGCPHSIWDAVFLDPRSFKNTTSIEVTFGTTMSQRAQKALFWDISRSRKRFYDGEVGFGPQVHPAPPPAPLTFVAAVDDETTDDYEMDYGDSYLLPEQLVAPNVGVMPMLEEEADHVATTTTTEDNGNAASGDQLTAISVPNVPGALYVGLFDGMNVAMQNAVGAMLYPEGHRVKQPYLEAANLDDHSDEVPDCPILVVAKRDIFLFQSFRDCVNQSSAAPYIVLHEPLFQIFEEKLPAEYDRLCFVEQIPELGVVIVASSIGRAAVLTLTCNAHVITPGKPVFGFRLDHLLPFPEQERDGYRPACGGPLLGIAVSPIQGMLGVKQGPRRWRLLMYYSDHTVLPYEIGKEREPQNQGVETLVI